MKHKYSIQIAWSPEDKAFIASVPELPGCASDGSTQEEAIKNLGVIVDEWLETAREIGREIPPPVDVIRMEEDITRFQQGLQEHVQREVQAAVARILGDLARSQTPNLWTFRGRFAGIPEGEPMESGKLMGR